MIRKPVHSCTPRGDGQYRILVRSPVGGKAMLEGTSPVPIPEGVTVTISNGKAARS